MAVPAEAWDELRRRIARAKALIQARLGQRVEAPGAAPQMEPRLSAHERTRQALARAIQGAIGKRSATSSTSSTRSMRPPTNRARNTMELTQGRATPTPLRELGQLAAPSLTGCVRIMWERYRERGHERTLETVARSKRENASTLASPDELEEAIASHTTNLAALEARGELMEQRAPIKSE